MRYGRPRVLGGECSPIMTSTVTTAGATTLRMVARCPRSTPDNGKVISISRGLDIPTASSVNAVLGPIPSKLVIAANNGKRHSGRPVIALRSMRAKYLRP